MKNQKILLATLILSLGWLVGCSSSTDLGAQIDRMARPAVNTALNNTFTDDTTRNAQEDDYNSTDNANSVTKFKAAFGKALAVYDSLVAETAGACGDNPLTNRAAVGASSTLATGDSRYDLIAGVFADDQLYVNSAAGGTCTQYLAAELVVMGVTSLSSDCGGRTPTMDVIKTTYSAVAVGAATGVDDGPTADNATHSTTVFPFLSAPL